MSNDGANTVVGNQNTTVTDGNNSKITAGNGNDTLTAGTGSSVTAGNGNDSVTVGANSSISVGNGNDTISAGAGSSVSVGNGNDSITVGANSTVTAGNGNDTVTAGANSTVTVGNGNDTIYLGANDHVTVGNGKDTFVLPSSGQLALSAPQNVSVNEDGSIALVITASTSGFSFGNEVISGFNTSNDKIQVTTAEFASFAAVKAAATQVGNDTVIKADSTDSIVLQNVKLSSSTASDFVFTSPSTSNLTVTISGIPSGVMLTDTAGPLTVTNGSVTLTQAQLAGLTLKAGEVTSTTLTVTASDGAGSSATKTIALSVNPVAPTLTAPSTLTVNAGASVALGIIETPFDVRDAVSLKITGVPADATLSAGTHNADGSWTLTPAQLSNLTLNAGSATSAALTVTATNTLGQTASTTASIQLNVVTPLKVTFDAVSFTDTGVQGDHLTNNGSSTFSGTLTDTVAVSNVSVFNNGSLVGSATVDNVHHTWSLTTTLGEGNYNQLTATATDASHNTASVSTSQFVKVDTTGPSLVSQSESVSGLTQSKVDVITVNATDPNGVASVAIYDDLTGQKLGNATLNSGAWSYTATELADGAHNFHAVITDNAGNQTTTADLSTVTVDTTGPIASIAASTTGPTKVTSDTITVSATDANGVASVAIYDDATGQRLGNATHGAGPTWTYTATGLADGSHNFHALVTDNAGNQSSTGEVSVLVDTVAPNVTFDAVSYDQTGTPGFSKDGHVTFSGTTSDSVTVSQVQIFNGSQLMGTATVDNVNHTWNLTETLSQGTYANLSAVATDEAGNSSSAGNTGETQTLQIDTTAPSVTMNTVSFVDTGVQNDGITANSLVTMSGTVSDDVTVSQVQVFSGSNLLGNAVVDNGSHTWAFTGNLADGTYQNLHAVATDEAGNSTTANDTGVTQSVKIDTTAPAITFDNVTLAHAANGSSTTTNDGQVTFSGAVSDNVSVAQVQVFDGTQQLGIATVSNGTWSLSTQLGVGSYHELHATAIDAAGNSSDAGSQSSVNVTPAAGYVADGYIQGATVFADSNGNGKLDPGEASGTTDATGHFVLGPGSTTGTLVMSGGTDTATNLPFTGVLTAPTGSTQVTPLTTLVQAVAAANGGDVAAASHSVATALGLNASTDLSNLDTVATAYQGNSDAFVAASKVLNTVSMVASAVSGTGATDFSTAAASTFSALANQIVTNGTLDLNSSSVVTAVASDALTSVSSSATFTSDQTSAIATVVTSVNTATDQAVADSSGAGTAALLTNVSATSIVAQGSTSSQLQQGTASGDLATAVANNTGTALSNSVDSAVSQVGNVAPAPPTVLGLTATNSSPNNLNQVHYLLAFSDPVTGIVASDFNVASNGLSGVSVASITPVAGSNSTQYDVVVNAGSGDGTLTLSFTGTTVQDVAQNPLQDQTTHTGPTYTIDHDANEQASLALAVNSQINTAGSAVFNFTVSGLDSDDTGIVTFTDGQNQVTMNVTGSQTTYAANLSSLTDGPISSVLSVNTDPAGNSFTPVSGTSALSVSGFSTSNNGVNVIQSGSGDIAVVGSRSIVAQSGHGILAEQNASGLGNIVVNTTGSVRGTGTGSDGILAMNLDAANGGNVTVTASGGATGTQNAIQASTNGMGTVSVHAGGNITATGQAVSGQGQYGIRALNDGTGSISVITDAGTVINSGGEGISVANRNTNIPVSANASVAATVNGTINFGSIPNPSGSAAKGIDVGFFAGGNDNPNVHGTVVLNNNANVTQTVGNTGNGVNAYSYGDGSVTLNEGAGTVVSAGQIGVAAFGLSAGNSFNGGANDVTVNVGDNARITGIASFGVQAYDSGEGNVSLTTGNGDIINGGSDGILASNSAKSVSAGHTVTVNVGTDTVHSSTRVGINAGYNPGNVGVINGNVHGDVFLTSNATVTAVSSAVNAFNWGTGNVTVVTGAASSENSSTATGIFAGAFDGGNVSLTNGGSATGKTGLSAQAVGNGNIILENDGTATGTQFSGINVIQNAPGATGSTTITNTGTVTGTGNSSAINVNENATGTVTFNNSGTLGQSVITSTTTAISVNGGSQVTVNNTGHMNGYIFTGPNGGIAGGTTINNEAGAVWQTSYLTDDGTIVATHSTIDTTQGGSGMVVGNAGNGYLTLQAGALLTSDFLNVAQQAGSSGTVLVTGAGTSVNLVGQSPDVWVGQNGTASLTIADNATVTTATMDVAVNHDAGVTDTLDVNHATLTSSQGLTIGDAGTATATVENGGTIDTGYVSLGNQTSGNGSLMVTGPSSALNIQGTSNGIDVGFSGTGNLTVAAGAALTADFLNIGQQAGSSGTVLVTGVGTTVDTTAGQFQNILDGNDGTATFTIADHAIVTTTNMELATDHQVGVTDTLVIDDATLTVVQGLSVGISGTANATVANGGTLNANFIGLAQQAGSSADLIVTGPGSSVSTSFMQVNSGATLDVEPGGTVTVNGMDNEGIVVVNGGTLDVEGQLTGAGTITLSNGARLVLESSTTFAPITVASTGSTVTVSVDNDVLTVSGDGNIINETGNNESLTLNGNNDTVSLTGNGGIINVAGGNAAITLSGSSDQVNVASPITGSVGISVIQSGVGDVNLSAANAITGQSGHGILAEQNASGVGNIVVNTTGSVTGSGTGSDGILAMNLNAANGGNVTVTATGGASGTQNAIQASTNGTGTVFVHAGGNITATGQPTAGQGQYGIRALNDGTGSISVVTDDGTVINSGGEGVGATNRNTNVPLIANASVTATINGTINFGSVLNPSGSPAKGIDVGFYAGGSGNPNVNGTVVVNNFANVTETAGNQGYAVSAYNYGDGSVTLNEGAGTVVSAGQIGIGAFGNSASSTFTGGANDITVNVGDNASITGVASFGLQAYDSGVGNVSVTTGNGDIINGGSDGILASNSAKSISAGHTITVNVGADTVHSGRFGINAGYNPGNASVINGNVHGDVFLTSNATVTAANTAVNGFNWGTGNVTVVTGAASSENSSTATGIFAGAFDGGNVSLTNGGSATGKTGLIAQAVGSGNIILENDGTATGTQFSGINVIQNAAGATGSTTITNTGTVTGTGNSSAINVNENATGTVTFNNSGIVGSGMASSSKPAITENGGAVIINNNGQIIGNVYTTNNGQFTGIFNNNAGASWQSGFIDDEGTITASGPGSTITLVGNGIGMVVGNSATGSMTIADGAMLTAAFLNVGFFAGSHGTVTVTGAGTIVDQLQTIGLGFDGTASLTISDHAVVNTANMDIAVNHDASVTDTLDVNNASLNVGVAAGLTVGDAGTAHATVENGGTIGTGFLTIANQAGSVGSLTVDGAGSVVSATGLTLGSGSASLSVTHGGAVDVGSGTTSVADAVHVGSSALLQGAGTIEGNVVDDGSVVATNGSLDISGSVTGTGSLSIAAGAHLEVSSSVSSNNTVIFQATTGSLILDHSAGQTINFSGFTGDGSLSGSDQIDLKDIDFSSGITKSFDANNNLTVTDGHGDSAVLHFAGSYQLENFNFADDGTPTHGTIVFDPPVPSSTPAIGGAPSVGTSGFDFADHASPIVQTVEHVLEEIIKPEVTAIKELLGGCAGNGTIASLIDHLVAAVDGQMGDKTMLNSPRFSPELAAAGVWRIAAALMALPRCAIGIVGQWPACSVTSHIQIRGELLGQFPSAISRM